MSVVTTIATNDNEVEEDGRMRIPEVIGGSAIASLSHRRLQAEPWPAMTQHTPNRLDCKSGNRLRKRFPTQASECSIDSACSGGRLSFVS
jgi:hypothetical protein